MGDMTITTTPLYKRMLEAARRDFWPEAPNDFLIDPDKKLIEDYGMDDLDDIEFIMILEEEFNTPINDELASQAHTMRDFYDILVKRGIDPYLK